MRGRASRHSAPARCGRGATGAAKSRTPPTRRRYPGAVIGPAIMIVDDDARRPRRSQDAQSPIATAGTTRSAASTPSPTRRRSWSSWPPTASRLALVLVALRLITDGHHELLDDIRRLHPHAKRVVVIAWDDNGDPDVGATILDAVGSGRLDHFVAAARGRGRRSAALTRSPDCSSTGPTRNACRRTPCTSSASRGTDAPTTSGTRSVAARSPTRSHWPTPTPAARSSSRPAARTGSRSSCSRTARSSGIPTNAEIAAATGTPEHPEERYWDLVIIGWRPGGAVRRGVRRLGRPRHAGDRRGRRRRAGDVQLAHPQLPGVPARHQRTAAGPPARSPRPGCSAPASSSCNA